MMSRNRPRDGGRHRHVIRASAMVPLVILLPLLLAPGLITACAGRAEPSKPVEASRFPDMSGYTPVDPDEYLRQTDNPGRPEKLVGYYFDTPDGIHCGFTQSPAAGCAGNNFPSIPPAKCDPVTGPVTVNSITTDSGLRKVALPTCGNGAAGKVLPPFHTLTVYGVTCGVDDKRMTACRDTKGRGFVLSPAWSGWLEHV